MAKTNFKAKAARALSNLISMDNDLWKDVVHENAFNSNLYKRIGKRKNTTLDMEYDKYNLVVNGAHFSKKDLSEIFAIDNRLVGGPTGSRDYNPRPDIISHGTTNREAVTIDCVIESKFSGNIAGIKKDYWKLLCYKALYNAPQLIIVVFPKPGIVSRGLMPSYKGSFEVWKWEFLEKTLSEMEDYEGAVFNLDPSARQISQALDISASFGENSNGELVIKNSNGLERVVSFEENKVSIKDNPDNFEVIANGLNFQNISQKITAFSFSEISENANFSTFLSNVGEINPLNADIDYFGSKRFYRISTIFNDNYEENYNNDEAFNSLRNLIVFTRVDNNLVMLLPGTIDSEDTSIVNFDKEYQTFFDRSGMTPKEGTIWKSYSLKERGIQGNDGAFINILNLPNNRLAILKVIEPYLEKLIKKEFYTESKLLIANEKLNSIRRMISELEVK